MIWRRDRKTLIVTRTIHHSLPFSVTAGPLPNLQCGETTLVISKPFVSQFTSLFVAKFTRVKPVVTKSALSLEFTPPLH